MILIRLAIGTLSLALLGMAFTLEPPPNHHTTPALTVAVMHH